MRESTSALFNNVRACIYGASIVCEIICFALATRLWSALIFFGRTHPVVLLLSCVGASFLVLLVLLGFGLKNKHNPISTRIELGCLGLIGVFWLVVSALLASSGVFGVGDTSLMELNEINSLSSLNIETYRAQYRILEVFSFINSGLVSGFTVLLLVLAVWHHRRGEHCVWITSATAFPWLGQGDEQNGGEPSMQRSREAAGRTDSSQSRSHKFIFLTNVDAVNIPPANNDVANAALLNTEAANSVPTNTDTVNANVTAQEQHVEHVEVQEPINSGQGCWKDFVETNTDNWNAYMAICAVYCSITIGLITAFPGPIDVTVLCGIACVFTCILCWAVAMLLRSHLEKHKAVVPGDELLELHTDRKNQLSFPILSRIADAWFVGASTSFIAFLVSFSWQRIAQTHPASKSDAPSPVDMRFGLVTAVVLSVLLVFGVASAALVHWCCRRLGHVISQDASRA